MENLRRNLAVEGTLIPNSGKHTVKVFTGFNSLRIELNGRGGKHS